MGKLLNAALDVVQCAMAGRFVELPFVGIPTCRDFLDTGHVDTAIVTECFQIGHVCAQESSILSDGIPAEKGLAWFTMFAE